MSIVMVFEMTQDYQVMLPLMVASVTAHYVAKHYRQGRSIYYESLHGNRALEPGRLAWTELVRNPEPTVLPEDPAEALKARFSQTPFNSLQVVDASGIWLGVVGRSRVLAAPSSTPADELLEPDSQALDATMTLQEALEEASTIRSELLPVVDDPEASRYLGTIYKSDLLLILKSRLGEMRNA
jgi:CIC family chloride channel protein